MEIEFKVMGSWIFGALFAFLVCFAPVQGAFGTIYVVDIHYSQGELDYSAVKLGRGYFPERLIQPESGHTCEVISCSGEVLYSFRYGTNQIIFPPPPREGEDPGSPYFVESFNKTLIVPYFRDASMIKIYDEQNSTLANLDVSMYSPACIVSENPGSSLEIGPESGEDAPDIENGETQETNYWVIGIIFLVIILAILLMWRLKRRKDSAPSAESFSGPSPPEYGGY
ncbi:MAG: hypothetical protein JW727_01290 [Candidatus Aenigmarchaeota archaeon]|nr:hypothetical protein [Candidatus Aenigmarchaeota archaeon]